MKMEVKILGEAGYEFALQGIGKSFGVTDKERLKKVAYNLCDKDGGHNKFLESIVVWIDVTASRYWWAEADTYRVGMTKQSESTIHTIAKKQLTQNDFSDVIPHDQLSHINSLIDVYVNATKEDRKPLLKRIKANLPEGYLQSRVMCTNYKTLKNMFLQRKNHVLDEWRYFIKEVLSNVEHPEFLSSVLD